MMKISLRRGDLVGFYTDSAGDTAGMGVRDRPDARTKGRSGE